MVPGRTGSDFGGLADAEVAAAVKALGKEAREELWHVLHDEDGQREVGGQRGEQNIEGGGAAGGDADGDDGRGGRDGLWPIGGADGLTKGQDEGRARRAGKDGRAGQGLRRWKELIGEALVRAWILGSRSCARALEGGFAAGLAGGFGHVVGRATGEGFNGDAGAALGERTAHDDRHFVSLPSQFFEGDQSIHDGHLHIEQDQVGVIEGEAAEGGSAVGGGSGDFKRRVGADDGAQQAAHDGRVVDDEDAGAANGRHGLNLDSDLDQAEHGEFFVERLVVEGFHEVFVGAGIEGAQDEVVLSLGGDHENLGAGVALGTHCLEHFKAVHDGHVPVEEREVEGEVAMRACRVRLFRRRPRRTRFPFASSRPRRKPRTKRESSTMSARMVASLKAAASF